MQNEKQNEMMNTENDATCLDGHGEAIQRALRAQRRGYISLAIAAHVARWGANPVGGVCWHEPRRRRVSERHIGRSGAWCYMVFCSSTAVQMGLTL